MIGIKIETDCRIYIITKSKIHCTIHCIRVSYVIQDLGPLWKDFNSVVGNGEGRRKEDTGFPGSEKKSISAHILIILMARLYSIVNLPATISFCSTMRYFRGIDEDKLIAWLID